MVAFLLLMLGCFAFFGAVIALIYRWIQKDTYEYDMEFVWDRYTATLEGMGFRKG
ncbi:hypothetical protein [Paenibacillus sp. GYB003]|uniref:hypothetical protein n=1 Tax=Paenibacillus sp. GYB003 TaxID=2994392 RepID=UPI002F9651D8